MHHHMPAGPGHQHIPPSTPYYSQRQRDYHAYHGSPAHSPMHQNPYASTYYQQAPPQYYQPYPQQPQWSPQPQMQYQQQYMAYHNQMQPMPYNMRSSPMAGGGQPTNGSRASLQRQQGTQAQYIQQPPPSLHSMMQETPTAAAQAPQKDPEMDDRTPESERVFSSSGQSEAGESSVTSPLQLPAEYKTPYYPKLPWYSSSTSPTTFPPRATARRKKRSHLHIASDSLVLPSRGSTPSASPAPSATPDASEQARPTEDQSSEVSTVAAPSDAETPATSHAPSESEFTQVSTPPATTHAAETSPKPAPTQAQHTRRDTRTIVAVPNIPNLPRHKANKSSDRQTQTPVAAADEQLQDEEKKHEQVAPQSPAKPAPPKSWADLVRIQGAKAPTSAAASDVNGVAGLPKNATLAEALRQYVVQSGDISFIEPRGLVNTGNMCYMNSILQVLVFCVPFYNFLDQVRSRTVYSIRSETPLLDAMIMFMRELKVLASASNVSALRNTLKPEQLERYGEPIVPEYIYDAIKHLPRFQSMRRGHQQDAEEFLGFVLEGLHDECMAVMQSGELMDAPSEAASEQAAGDGWLEVGPKQKAAVTRTAGQQDAPSPVTKIFGGHLRSELRVPGQKDSVTLEPYKPLQLDIGAPHINNIIDALKGLTYIENLTGDFGGRGNTAKKQVFIDSLPPVLILHLKRFQYDNNLTGTQKIWKKVGYPLELEIPKEVFTQSKRAGLTIGNGLPKYRLTSVVYHHGKSAAGGHYTVDVLRQDFKEWVRIDDTFIKRIRAEDVAEGGAGEDPKVLARALEQHKAAQELQKQRNMYDGLDEDELNTPWSEVNGSAERKAKMLNGAGSTGVATPSSATGKRTPTAKREGVKDNKVAYILLYERIEA